MATTNKTSATIKASTKNTDVVNEENYVSKEEYLKLLKQMEEITKKLESTPVAVSTPVSSNVFLTNSPMEKDVPVISMCLGQLNLCTEKSGGGTCYTFNNFNEIMDIPYGDLKDIIKSNPRFVNEGYFYIADEQAVKALRKESAYKRIIEPETIAKIFNYAPNRIIDLYKMAPKGQQELIIQMIRDKRLNAEKVDGNIMMELGKLANIDFISMEPIESLKTE